MNFSKNKYFFHAFLFVVLVFLDQLSKFSALRFITSSAKESFLGFSLQEPVKNYNLIFDLNFGQDHLLINTSVTAIFCLFVFYYIISLIFIPKHFHYLQTGITILFSGFASNTINKLINGYVLDFIKWTPFEFMNIYFNLADIFQTAAWLFILIQIITLRKYIWRETENRKQLLVMKAYQLEFIGYCVLVFFCLSSFFLLINYQFIGLIEAINFANIHQISSSFLKYSFFILFLFCLFICIFCIYLSNKIYGPVYAFQRYTRALLNGESPRDLQIRKHDQFKHLEVLAKDIKKGLAKSR